MALNIYEFLGYKDTIVDDKVVLDTLQKEKQKWTNKMMQQPDRAKSKLELIKILEAELKANPNMLSEHKKMFGDVQKEKRKTQEKALREDAMIFVINGEIDEIHLNALQKRNSLFSTEEILEILGARIKARKRPKPGSTEKGNIIDRFIYKTIVEELKSIGKKDLYDFVGLKHSATIPEIKASNEKIYSELVTGSINREGYNSIKNLTGIVKTWLYTEDKRADYDKTLNNEAFQSVANKIDQIASTGKIIQPEQYKMLVEECTRKGMEFERAEGLIYDYAESKNITIVDGGLSKSTTICRFCGSINDKNSVICKNKDCGMPLIVTCPLCGKKSASFEEMRCTNTECGFNISDMPKALKCLNDAKTRIGFLNIDGAMQSYLEAEEFWPGYKGLSDIKSKILLATPPAPKSLVATSSGTTVNLQWLIPETKYIKYEYLVVRKADSAPNSPKDGVLVSITTDNKMSDVITEAGVSYYYAVYTRNGNTLSVQSATTSAPVMVVADLKGSDITLDVQETQIVFNFKKTHAQSIVIYRDEIIIGTISGTTFIDKDLITGKSYIYRFVAIYVDNNGNLHHSNGLTQTLSPIAPPKPVELRLDNRERMAILSWDKPPVGTVVIFQSDKPFPILAGNKVSIDSMRYEQVDTVGTSVSIAKNWSGIKYYLPVTIQGGICVAGKSLNIISIDVVTNVNISLEERKIIVKWSWENCFSVRISYTIDGKIKKYNDIEKVGSSSPVFEFLPPEGCKSISVSVMAKVTTSEQTLLSAPFTKIISLKPTKVQFVSAKNKKSFFMSSNKYEITYTADSALPCNLNLLVNESVPPMNLRDCIPIAEIKASSVLVGKTNSTIVEYIRKNKSVPLFFRLIVADRTLSKSVIVNSEIIQIK